MSTAISLALLGTSLAFVGSALLFVYGLPRKKVGNVFIGAETVHVAEPLPGERGIPENEWKPIAARFQKYAKNMNRVGFALTAIGALLQVVAMVA